MRITGCDIRRVAIPLEKEVRWVGASESANDLLMLRISTDAAGVFGLSQKKVHLAWSGMTSAAAAKALSEVYEPLLKGRDPLDAETLWDEIDRIPGWSPAKVLVDIALHDIAARAASQPMWRFLGGVGDQVPLLGFVARGGIVERLAMMRNQVERFGFTGFKIKIGGDTSADLDFLRQVRGEFGPDLLLRVDANWGYAPERVLEIAEALAALGVEDFEDPCALQDREVRRRLFAEGALPIVVDHAIASPEAARAVIEDGAQRIALKVSRLGYRQCVQIAAACRAAGVAVVAGSMTECATGALASLHFHAGHPEFAGSPAEDGYFLTLPDDVCERPQSPGGAVALGDAPGISSDWDDAKMWRYAVPLDAG